MLSAFRLTSGRQCPEKKHEDGCDGDSRGGRWVATDIAGSSLQVSFWSKRLLPTWSVLVAVLVAFLFSIPAWADSYPGERKYSTGQHPCSYPHKKSLAAIEQCIYEWITPPNGYVKTGNYKTVCDQCGWGGQVVGEGEGGGDFCWERKRVSDNLIEHFCGRDIQVQIACPYGGTQSGGTCNNPPSCGRNQSRDPFTGICETKDTNHCPLLENPIQPALASKFQRETDCRIRRLPACELPPEIRLPGGEV